MRLIDPVDRISGQAMGEEMRLQIVLAAIVSVLMIASAHAQDGARAYFPVPAGTNDIDLTGTYVHTEVKGSVFDSPVFTPSYRHTFDVGGDAVTFLIGMPFGKVSSTILTGIPLFPSFTEDTNIAQGDMFVGATVGLVNAPALAPMDYATYQPGFTASIATRLFLPTGDYDTSRVANLGANRWTLQVMLPMSFVMANSLVDPNLTTFDVMPTVQIFGDNDNPSLAGVASQAPLFGLEAHVTHSFGPMVWGSLDAAGKLGGESKNASGVSNDDSQQSLALGATLGLNLSQSVAMRLSYQKQVYSKTPKSDSQTVMITTAILF
jgi:hypothetical protein